MTRLAKRLALGLVLLPAALIFWPRLAVSEDGGAPDDGGAPGPEDGGPATDGGVPGDDGGAGKPDAPPSSCGDILIVLDRSGSMAACSINGTPKEAIAKEAIKTMVGDYPTVGMGLFVFPDTLDPGSCASHDCKAGKVVENVAIDGAPRVLAYLDKMPTSCGGTPTGDSMQVVKDYAGWPGGKAHYVLLITDGQPTCQDGDNGGSPPKMCDGMGSIECKNPTKVYEAIEALRNKGIRTFVVGFEGNGVGMGCGTGGKPYNPDTLNIMADKGGMPNTMGGATHYYPATDAGTLKEALRRIAGAVGSDTVGGCKSGGGSGGEGGGGAGGGGAGGGQGGSGGSGSGGSKGESGSSGGCGCAVSTAPQEMESLAVLFAALGLAVTARRRRGAR